MNNFNYRCNDEITVLIGSINDKFEGVVNFKNKKLIVKNSLPDEKILVRISKIQKNTAFADIVKIITPSESRVGKVKDCNNCKACNLHHISYNYQLEIKNNILQNLFNFPSSYIGSVFKGYRNKINIPIIFEKNKYKAGYYEPYSHSLTEFPICPALKKEFNFIIEDLLSILNKNFTKSPLPLKNLFIRGTLKHGFQVGINLKNNDLRIKDILLTLGLQHKEIRSLFYSLSDTKSENNILISKPETIYGKPYIEISVKDITFKVRPSAFFQQNIFILENILNQITDYYKNIRSVLDLFSGTGILSAFFKNLKKRICFEVEESAFIDADKSIGEFIVADAYRLNNFKLPETDLIIIDPPRKGAGAEVINLILRSKANYVAYLSCNPVSQKKEIDNLKAEYKIDKITGYDMFPNTSHIESLVFLKKINPE